MLSRREEFNSNPRFGFGCVMSFLFSAPDATNSSSIANSSSSSRPGAFAVSDRAKELGVFCTTLPLVKWDDENASPLPRE